MDDNAVLTDPISPCEGAGIVLERLGRRFRYTGALVTVRDPGRARETPLVNRGYCPTFVDFMVDEFIPEHPVFRMIAARAAVADIVSTQRTQVGASLSPRETEILRHLATGLSNAEIAERIVVSRRTVATHVEHILHKLGAANRVQAALQAVAFGLVAADSVPAVRGGAALPVSRSVG